MQSLSNVFHLIFFYILKLYSYWCLIKFMSCLINLFSKMVLLIVRTDWRNGLMNINTGLEHIKIDVLHVEKELFPFLICLCFKCCLIDYVWMMKLQPNLDIWNKEWTNLSFLFCHFQKMIKAFLTFKILRKKIVIHQAFEAYYFSPWSMTKMINIYFEHWFSKALIATAF